MFAKRVFPPLTICEVPMDRGIKIAILVACVLSLGLGLIWDRVIDTARTAALPAREKSALGPDPAAMTVGDMRLPRAEAAVRDGANTTVEAAAETPAVMPGGSRTSGVTASPKSAGSGYPEHIRPYLQDGKYVVQPGDSPWKVANTEKRFKFHGKNSTDWTNANPNAKWRAGELLNIP